MNTEENNDAKQTKEPTDFFHPRKPYLTEDKQRNNSHQAWARILLHRDSL